MAASVRRGRWVFVPGPAAEGPTVYVVVPFAWAALEGRAFDGSSYRALGREMSRPRGWSDDDVHAAQRPDMLAAGGFGVREHGGAGPVGPPPLGMVARGAIAAELEALARGEGVSVERMRLSLHRGRPSVARAATRLALARCLAQIPPRRLNATAMAEHLGCHPDTVRGLVRDGRSSLRAEREKVFRRNAA